MAASAVRRPVTCSVPVVVSPLTCSVPMTALTALSTPLKKPFSQRLSALPMLYVLSAAGSRSPLGLMGPMKPLAGDAEPRPQQDPLDAPAPPRRPELPG